MGVRITIDIFICLFSLPRPACTPAVAIRFLQIRLHELHKFLRCGGLGHIPQHTQIHASGRDSESCLQLLQLSAGQVVFHEFLRYSGHTKANGRQVYQ